MTEMNDPELQAAYREILRDRPAGRASCPPVEAIGAIVERRGAEMERLATLDHVMNCGACQAEFDLIQATAAGQPLPARRYSTSLAAAASIALLVSAAMLFRAVKARDGGDETMRGASDAIELVTPRGETGSRPVSFVWRAVPGVVRYGLEVFNAAGDPVYTTEVRDTAAVLPGDTRLVAGETYHWWVLVRTSEGAEVRSRPVTFKP